MNTKFRLLKTTLTLLLFSQSLLSISQTAVQQGTWRGVFYNRDGYETPFNFEIEGKTIADTKVYLINGDERALTDKIINRNDSLIIPIDQFDNELAFKIENSKKLIGVLRRQNDKAVTPLDTKGLPVSVDRTGLPLKVIAEFGKSYRFNVSNEHNEKNNLTGKWDVIYTGEDGQEIKTVGLFKQNGNKLTGTFLKITGDARYLEGNNDGKNFSLSSFIGTGPNLIQATFDDNNSFSGLSTAPSGKYKIKGIRNDHAALPDPTKLTFLKEGYTSFDLSFPDINGKKISLKDERFKNKVVVLTITGTWCPNCMDEAAFIAPWYKKNKDRGVEVVSIYYERKTEPEYIKKVLTRVKEKYGIEYEQLVGGLADKKQVAESLPLINKFIAFPTTIFIDRNGNIAQIYTGISGPATGTYYDAFINELNAQVDQLLEKKSTERSAIKNH